MTAVRRRDAGLLSILPGWRERWIAALRSFGWPVPVPRGRTARLTMTREGVTASVRAGGGPQHVRVRLAPLPARTFEAAMRRLSGRAASAASLLSGQLPDDVETAFTGTKLGLLPRRPEEVRQSCTCDGESPCAHLLAAHAALAARLATDPMLLFELRGRSREEVLERVRRLRALAAPARSAAPPGAIAAREEAPAPLPEAAWERPESFFKPLLPIGTLAVSTAPRENSEAVLTRLGTPPLSDPDAARLLVDLHRAIGLGAAERLAEWEWRHAGKS
jgi:uncharacterized Zn finger protein